MAGFATAALATTVSLSGGIGLIGSVTDMAALDAQLHSARRTLLDDGMLRLDSQTLPIGVGFLLFITPLAGAVDVVRNHKPAIVWLSFARSLSDFALWAAAMREASPQTKIWIQLGTVSAALEVASTASPDMLIMQGADAGGHGFAQSAGVVSLVPETIDALYLAGHSIPILAAGGIVEGRGVAAALSLGASGVVMGTRFLSAEECEVPHPLYRECVLKARDGGQATVRATVFDGLRGPNIWPAAYDGRAIRNESWADAEKGTDVEEIRKRFAEAAVGEEGGYAQNGKGAKGRAMIWAGAGVGMVNSLQPAGEILDEVRDGARQALDRTRAIL